MKLAAGLALCLALAGCGSGDEPGRAEIVWDEWGVPHVFAPDEESLFRALGWAQTHSHGNLLLKLYGEARGRAAEYWGAAFLPSDRLMWTAGVPGRAEEWYRAQTPGFRRLLDAFAAGINAYAEAHPDALEPAVRQVLPVSAVDVLAHQQRITHFTFVADESLFAQATEALQGGGSNAWAVAPARSASGHALLLINPHLPWRDRFLFYEVHAVLPDLNLTGAAPVGFPAPVVGFNDHLGWAHTVNAHDGVDLYELTLDGKRYSWNGEPRALEERSVTLRVLQPDGERIEEPHVVWRSVHGPVLAHKEDRGIAARVVGLDRPGCLEQWWAMARATSLSGFEAALQRMQLPTFTVMYADRAGNILHLFGGLTPVRPPGDHDWSGVVPGDTAATLWTETHAYGELPRVLNPASGWLQNANDPPWTTTLPAPLDPRDYPAYLAPPEMSLRAQRSARMLHEDGSITFDELVEYKHSTRLELADRLLDELLPAAHAGSSGLVRYAAQVLDRWDRRADAESRGALLFLAFVEELGDLEAAFARPWDAAAPLSTPDGFAPHVDFLSALERAAGRIEASYGSLDTPWGEAFRLRAGERDLPCSGGMGALGVFRVMEFLPDGDGRHRAYHGDTFVAAVEFGDPVRARVINTCGNASQPGSPYDGDQLELAARQELRPALRARAEVEAHATRRERVPGS